ncbi:phosphotyrosine protein phosphatase [Deinococcus sp. HMF7604]|uniref:arsenate reductase/protein-tyrosine-phosphatase family protein n=1 Tax=Deinococcus betulae TaxID=2873312 RepID=UPI001CCC23AF|nr:phosphotyrosine protein phosphatase [Deinococcus betulae]
MTRPLRVVFICTQNKLRSLTAEVLFRDTAGWEVASAGTNRDALTPLTRDVLEWADAAVCMQKRHRDVVRGQFRGALPDDRIVMMGIPDDYEFMASELVALLLDRVPARLAALSPRPD